MGTAKDEHTVVESNCDASIYRQLEMCKEYTLDDYWIHVFDMCSKGKFPKGTRFLREHNTLIVTDKTKKRKNYQLPQVVNDEYHTLFTFLMSIFKEDLGLCSDADRRELWTIYSNETVDSDAERWSDIRNKSTKEKLLQNYVLKLRNRMNLNVQEARNLLDSINFHIIMGNIGTEDIVLKNGEIDRMNGVKIEGDYVNIVTKYKKDNKANKKTNKKKWLECEKFIRFRNKVIPRPFK